MKFSIPKDLDLDLCLHCGQTFRWHFDGAWRGVDGEDWFIASDQGSFYQIESSTDEAGWWRRFPARPSFSDQDLDATYPGLRCMRLQSPVEVLFSFACASNNHVPRIRKMVEALARQGDPIGPGFFRFPYLERLALVTEPDLRAWGFGYRARTIPLLVQAVLERGGEPWLQALKQAPYLDARRALQDLPGIGPKLADCVALFGLHHGEAVPIDVHFWRAAQPRFAPEWEGLTLTAKRYDELGDRIRDRFGPHAGAAHQLLFAQELFGPKGSLGPR